MNLIELSLADKNQYNQFVANCPSGSFLQSWEWGQWQEKLGRRIFRYWILDDIGNHAASIQLIKMPLPFGRYYLYAPYGPVIQSVGVSECRQIGNFILFELERIFSVAVFIRVEPKSDLRPPTSDLRLIKSPNIQPGKTLLIDLKKPEGQSLAEMHTKTRYNIKLAQKHGVVVQEEFAISPGNGLYFKEAVELIVQTSGRQGFVSFPAKYYYNLIDTLALNVHGDLKIHIYKALFGDNLLSAAVMVDFGKTRTFLFGGSAEENRNVMAPYLLHWQAILDAKNLGFEFYDFWGIQTAGGETPGFVRFKLGFAPEHSSGPSGGGIKEYPGAYDYICKPLAYWLYTVFRRLNRFFKKILR